MVEGFAGFGFPKAHGAAFGLLAYQSTWLRVHYGPEFLCALLNEQPMGFYAPDSLVHEAEHRGIEVLGLDVNASQVQCTVAGRRRAPGPGLHQGRGRARRCASSWPSASETDPSPASASSPRASAPGAGRSSSWPGRAPATASPVRTPATARAQASGPVAAGGGRRQARRRRGRGEGTQLALPLELPAAPRLRPLGRWQRLIADYATSGVTVGDHAMADPARAADGRRMLATSAQLARLPTGCAVAVAGLVIARQRPGTAKGTMFLLFEDEFGTINLIVPKAVYERHRHLARAEPLLLARGRLERARGGRQRDRARAGARSSASCRRRRSRSDARSAGCAGARASPAARRALRRPDASVGSPVARRRSEGAEVGSSMRAVAPPVQSFATGGGGRARTAPALATLSASRAWATPTWTSFRCAWAGTCSAGRSTRSARSRCSTPTSQAGGNFIDTADSYGRRGPGGAGESERIIGRWIAARGNRERARDRHQGRHVPGAAGAVAGDDQAGHRGLAGAAGHRHASTCTTPTATIPTRRCRRRSARSQR